MNRYNSTFKQKPTVPMKRTALKKKSPLKKKSKVKLSVLKRKLWKVFSEYIRKRDKGICFICGRVASGSAYHAGHFIPKSIGGLALYFHESNVHGSCYHCNINLGGNLYEYGVKLGVEKVNELYQLKNQILKVDEIWYAEKIAYYSQKLNDHL